MFPRRRLLLDGARISLVTKERRTLGTFSKAITDDTKPPPAAKKPTVLLLGWAFAQDKQLSKYAALHNRLGYDTLAYTLPPPHFFTFDQDKIRADAAELCSQLPDSVVIHLFSNNGYGVYQHAGELLSSRLKGVILDSSPIPFTLKNWVGVPMWIRYMKGHMITRHFLAVAFFNLKYFTQKTPFFTAVSEAVPVHKELQPNWAKFYPGVLTPAEHALQDEVAVPQLWLYSQADTISPVTFFEEVIRERRRRGHKDVFEQDFGTSAHVAHYKQFPELYERRVKQFMEYVQDR